MIYVLYYILTGVIVMYLIMSWVERSFKKGIRVFDSDQHGWESFAYYIIIFGCWILFLIIAISGAFITYFKMKPKLQQWVNDNQFEIYELDQLGHKVILVNNSKLVKIFESTDFSRFPIWFFITPLGNKILISNAEVTMY